MNKTIKIVISILYGLIVLTLLISARQYQSTLPMQNPDINIDVQDGMTLITKSEIEEILYHKGLFRDSLKRHELDIKAIEDLLKNTNEIAEVEVFTKLDGEWFIQLQLKRPIVRIVDPNNEDFYIDSEGEMMHLSPYYRPKVLPVTGLNTVWGDEFEYNEVINNDSLITKYKLSDLYLISSYVCNDAFYNASIVQIEYVADLGFVLYPRLGGQSIILGEDFSKEEVDRMFLTLTTFYEEVMPYEGWDVYKTIDLRFEEQIVAKKN